MSIPESATGAGAPDAPDGLGVEKKAAKSAVLAAATHVLSLVLKFPSSVILASLLSPRDMGISNISWVVITAMVLLSDVGLNTAVVRSHRGEDPDFLDSVWTVGIVRSLVLWVGICLSAVPIARFYDEPRLVTILPVVGLVLILEAARSTYLEVADRRLDQRPRMKLELYGLVLTTVVQLSYAYVYPGPWALVVGSLTASTYRCIASHRMNEGRPNRFRWNRHDIDEIVAFGKWVFVSTAFTFVATQGDRILLGKVESLDTLGIYGVTCTIALIPQQIHGVIAGRVLFPLISTYLREDPATLEARLRSARKVLLAIMLASMVGVLTLSGPVVELAYPDRYGLAGTLAPIVGFISWIGIIQNSVDTLPLVHGESRLLAVISFTSMTSRIVCGLVGFRLAGLLGILGGLFVGALLEYTVVHVIVVLRYRVRLVSQDLVYTTALAFVGAIVFAIREQSLTIRIAVAVVLSSFFLAFAARALALRVREDRAARLVERPDAEPSPHEGEPVAGAI